MDMTPETAMLSPDRLPDLTPLLRANDDYAVVRRAIAYAVDRKRIASLQGGGLLAQPTCQLVPPRIPGYKRFCTYTLDPGPDEGAGPHPSTQANGGGRCKKGPVDQRHRCRWSTGLREAPGCCRA